MGFEVMQRAGTQCFVQTDTHMKLIVAFNLAAVGILRFQKFEGDPKI